MTFPGEVKLYTITTDALNDIVQEGQSITITITGTNVSDDEILYWTNGGTSTGGTGGDFGVQGISNQGTVRLINGEATLQLPIVEDNKVEGSETIIFQLRETGFDGPVVADKTIYINDSSGQTTTTTTTRAPSSSDDTTQSQVPTFTYSFPTSSITYIKNSPITRDLLPIKFSNTGTETISVGLNTSQTWIGLLDPKNWEDLRLPSKLVYIPPKTSRDLVIALNYPSSYATRPSTTEYENIKITPVQGAVTPQLMSQIVTGATGTDPLIAVKWKNVLFSKVTSPQVTSLSTVPDYPRYPITSMELVDVLRTAERRDGREDTPYGSSEYLQKFSFGSSFNLLNEDELLFNTKVLTDIVRKLRIILGNFSKQEGSYRTPGNSVFMDDHIWNFPTQDFPKLGSFLSDRLATGPEYFGWGNKDSATIRMFKWALADALFCQSGVCKGYPEDYQQYRFSYNDLKQKTYSNTLAYLRAIVQNYIDAINKAILADDPIYSRLIDTSKPITLTQPLNIQISTLLIPLRDIILSASRDVLNKKMLTYFDEEREYKTVLNFGDDKQYVATAWRRAPTNPNNIQFKLLNSLGDFGVYDTAYVSRELAKSVIDITEFEIAIADDGTPYLRPRNTNVTKYLPQSNKLQNQTLESLGLYTGSAGAISDGKITYEDLVFRRWFNGEFNTSELNIDFTDYNNFIQYGSAYHRLLTFYNKLVSIESLDSIIIGTGAGDAELAKRKENIIRGFDQYEQFLFFSTDTAPYSSSNAYAIPETEYNTIATWPKDLFGKPQKTSSTIASTWLTNQSTIARRYDENNPNYLIKHLPQHIQEDDESKDFLLFVSMVGHFIDNLKVYIDKFPDIYSTTPNPYEGLTVDQVYEVAKSFGLDLPNVFAIENLQKFISSVTGEEPARALGAEVWKRFLHIVIHMAKIKGTRTALDTLLNVYGISSPLIQIKETSYVTGDDYVKTDELTYGLEFSSTANNFVRVPLVSSSIATTTIQLRFLPELRQSSSLLTGDTNKWAVDVVPHPSASKTDYGRLHIVSGSNRVLIATSSYFRLFDEDYTNIMIRSQSGDLTITQTDGDQVLFQETILTSIPNTVWNDTTYVYIAGSGSLRSNNFDGIVDEFRGWGENISTDIFLQQSYDPGVYFGTYYTSSYVNLYSLLTFNEPLQAVTQSLPNESPYQNISIIPNFLTNDFSLNSYTRVLRTIKQKSQAIGGTIYTTNKIKVAPPPVFNSDSIDADGSYVLSRERSIKPINEKEYTGGKNIVSLGISPTDYVNSSIARTMGYIDINNVIGSPRKFTTDRYTELDELYDYYIANYVKTGSLQYVNFAPDSTWSDRNQQDNAGTGWQFLIGRKETSQLTTSDGVVHPYPGLPTYAAKISTRHSLHTTNWQFDSIPVQQGETYRISGYAYANGTTFNAGGTPGLDYNIGYLGVMISSSGAVVGYQTAQSAFGPIGWQYVEKQFTIGAGTSSIQVGPFIDGPYPYVTDASNNPIYNPTCTEAQAEAGCPGYAWFAGFKVERTAPIAGIYEQNNVVNPNDYIRFFKNLLQGPSEFATNIIPARAKLQTGTVIESPVLKRNKTYKVKSIKVDGTNTHTFDKFIAGSGSRDVGAYSFDIMPETMEAIPDILSDTQQIETSIRNTANFASSTDTSKVPPERYVQQYVNNFDTGSLVYSSLLDDRSSFNYIEAEATDVGDLQTVGGGYPRDPYLGIPERLDSEENTLIPFYNIQPRSDLEDVGTWQYFHKETGVYYFDIYTPKKQPYVVRYDVKVDSPVNQKYVPLVLVPTGSSTLLPGRRTTILPVQEYAAGTNYTGTIRIANIASLYGLSAGAGLRIRLYNTEAEREADKLRPYTTPPVTVNSGVLFDALMESDTDVYPYTLVQSENDGIFYYNIDNTTAATIISTIDVHYFTFAPETLIPMGYLPRHYKFNRDNRIGLKRRNYLGCKIVGVAFDGGPAWDVTPVGREPKAYVGKGGTTKLT